MNDPRHALVRQWARSLAIFVVAIAVAVLSRKFLLDALETRIVWVTFYPAVMMAA